MTGDNRNDLLQAIGEIRAGGVLDRRQSPSVIARAFAA